MMIRNVLVSLTRSHSNEAAVRAALALAHFHDARLTALVADDCTAAIGPILATQTDDGTVATPESGGLATRIPPATRHRSRRIDLAVIGAAPTRQFLFEPEVALRNVLARSKCSVLVVQPAGLPSAFARVAMLWKRDANHARAIADSMALVSRGAAVELLAFVPDDVDRWADEDAFVETLVQYTREGFDVRPRLLRAGGGDRAAAIFGVAVERRVDLLVIPSLRGRPVDPQPRSALTAAIFHRAPAPVLFAR